MNNPHILSAFDRDLEAVQAMVVRMGGLVETALLDAAEALDARDQDLAARVRKGDQAIDALEDQINTQCAMLLALRGPTAGDLRTVLTVMKIAAALERAGDYAKNMAKRTAVLADMAPIPGASGAIRRLAKTVVQYDGGSQEHRTCDASAFHREEHRTGGRPCDGSGRAGDLSRDRRSAG
jgi:phosphate transport system protein